MIFGNISHDVIKLMNTTIKMDILNTNNLITLGILIAAIAYLLKSIWSYYGVSVNCWFCNANTKISFSMRNQFICPSCKQYNGFKDDGSYNCIIEAQHDVFKNLNTYQDYKSKPKLIDNFGNNLCETCNIQQSLKVRALAEFSAISEDNAELEDFKNKLEEMYDLCQQCEALVHQTLGKQNSWLKPKLIAWRVLKSKTARNFILPTKQVFLNASGHRWVLSVTSLYLIASKLCVCFLTSPLSIVNNPESFTSNWLLHTEKLDILLALIGLGYVCQFYIFPSNNFKINFTFHFLGWLALVLLHNDINTGILGAEISCYVQLLVTLLNFLFMARIARTTPTRSVSKSLIFTPKIHTTTPKVPKTFANEDLTGSSAPVMNKNIPEEEIPITFKDLKIGTAQKTTPPNGAGVFSNQFQFAPSRNCYSETSLRSKNILQQPKFGSKITQSSWVAGGYWGESPKRRHPNRQNIADMNQRNNEFDLFSHTSSKSSGFVSQASENTGLYYPQYVDAANVARCNLSSRFGVHDEKKSQDSLDACSVSSCYSTACPTERHQFNDWKSSQCSVYSAQSGIRALENISNNAKISWWYTFFAFALGFSVSANIFLFFAFYKSDVILK